MNPLKKRESEMTADQAVNKMFDHEYSKFLFMTPDFDIPTGRIIKIFKSVEGNLIEHLLGQSLNDFIIPDEADSIRRSNKSIAEHVNKCATPFASLAVEYVPLEEIEGNTGYNIWEKGAIVNDGVKILTVPRVVKREDGHIAQDIYSKNNFTLHFIPVYSRLRVQVYVVTNSRAQSVNTATQWGFIRKNNQNKDFYMVDNKDERIPFRLPCVIPDVFINTIADAYCIKRDDWKSILKILNMFTPNGDPIYYKQETGSGKNCFVFEYPTPVRVKPLSTELNAIEVNSTHLGHAIRRQYEITFINPIAFRIKSPNIYLNPDNFTNYRQFWENIPSIVNYGFSAPYYSLAYNIDNKKNFGTIPETVKLEDIEFSQENFDKYGLIGIEVHESDIEKYGYDSSTGSYTTCAAINLEEAIAAVPQLKEFYDYLIKGCMKPELYIEFEFTPRNKKLGGNHYNFNWKEKKLYILDYILGLKGFITPYIDDYRYQEFLRRKKDLYYDNDLATNRMI